jgi:hypothetical protein
MTMRPARLLSVPALAAGLALGAGCGSSGTIDSGDARQLQDGLDGVRSAIDAGKCGNARARVATLRAEVSTLSVPTRLRRNLAEGIAKLDSATGRDCTTATTTQTTATTTQTTTTETVPTATTETTTTAPPTTTTPPTATAEPPPTATIEPPTGGVSPDPGQNGQGGNGE